MQLLLMVLTCCSIFISVLTGDVTVKLTNNNTPFTGKAEVSIDGVWGALCNQDYQESEAEVFCRQINCDGGRCITGTHVNISTSYSFNCDGTEDTLYNCSFLGSNLESNSSGDCDTDTECFPVTGVPGQVQITDVQSDSFSLSWMQPDDVPCQLIQGYRVQCRRDRVSIIYTANQTDTSSIRVNSLVPFTPYNCCVTSYNNNGGRERENCSNAMTLAVPPTAPRHINTSEHLATSVRVSWSAPRYTNGTISQYIVQCSHTEGTYQTITRTRSSLTPLTLSGLNPHESYMCCVSATNSAGTGVEGCGDMFLTADSVPGASPQNVTILEVSAHSVSLSWEPSLKEEQNGHLTGYVITVSEGAEQKERQQPYAYGTNATIAGLTGNTHYTLSLAAKTSAGTGPYSAAVNFKTKIYAAEAGVFAMMTFSIVFILFPSLITCVLVLSCYKVDRPSCFKRKIHDNEKLIPKEKNLYQGDVGTYGGIILEKELGLGGHCEDIELKRAGTLATTTSSGEEEGEEVGIATECKNDDQKQDINDIDKMNACETTSLDQEETTSLGQEETTSLGQEETTSLGKGETTSLGKSETTSLGKSETTSLGKGETTSLGKSETTILETTSLGNGGHYQQLQSLNINKPNTYETTLFSQAESKRTPQDQQGSQRDTRDYEAISVEWGRTKMDTSEPKYEHLQMQGIDKPSIYATIGCGGDRSTSQSGPNSKGPTPEGLQCI